MLWINYHNAREWLAAKFGLAVAAGMAQHIHAAPEECRFTLGEMFPEAEARLRGTIMKISNMLAASALGVTLLVGGAAQAAVDLGVDFSGAPNLGASVWNLGWSFSANANASVVGLGDYFATPPASFPQPQQVGLWDSSGNLLASVYVTGSETPVGTAPWVFEPITPVPLTAGQTYVVGAQGGADWTGFLGSATLDPRITFGTALFTFVGSSNNPLVEPMSPGSGFGDFGGNVELAATAVIPEPSTWALMAIGFAGLGCAAYRRKRHCQTNGRSSAYGAACPDPSGY
jgi:Domain of unknown function (DUF4082)/PEP-CTERM motif